MPLRAGQRHRLPRRDRPLHPRGRPRVPGVRRRYTNAPAIIRRGLPRHRGPRRAVLGLGPRDAHLRPGDLAVRGRGLASGAGQREQGAATGEAAHGAHGAHLRAPFEGRAATRRCSTRAACSSCCASTSPATRPSSSRRPAASRASSSSRWPRRCARTRAASARCALFYAVGWTQHTRGRAVHPRRRDHPAAAGQHRPPRRRHHGAARTRVDPGLDRHPDALRHPARLPADAARSRPARTLQQYLEQTRPETGYWGNASAYIVSLLKAWWGDAATADNDFCFDYLPRITGDHSYYQTCWRCSTAAARASSSWARTRRSARPTASCSAWRMAKLDWLVVRDLVEIETAAFWHDAPEIESGELRTEDIGTEVFLLPAATHVEKAGTFTNTQRLLQWRQPGGGAARGLPLRAVVHVPPRPPVREKLAGSTEPRDRPMLDLTWDYPHRGPERRARRRGSAARDLRRRARGRQGRARLPGAEGRRLHGLRLLDLLRASTPTGSTRPLAASPAREQSLGGAGVGLGVADEPPHALQPRLGRPRRKAVVGAQALRLVGRGGGQVDRRGRAGLPRDHPPALSAAGGSARRGRARGRRRLHHAGRREGLAVRALRLGGRAATHPLRARGVAVRQHPAPRPAVQPGPPAVSARRESLQR